MKTLRISTLIIAGSLFFSFGNDVPLYSSLPGSLVQFRVNGFMGIDVKGRFTRLSSNIRFHEDDMVASYAEAVVPVSSISTGNSGRDRHLLSSDFFDADKYPEIRFISEKFRRSDDGFVCEGFLQIKNVRKKISIPFRAGSEKGTRVFDGHFYINRVDYNVGESSAGAGNKVRVKLRILAGPVLQK